MRPLSAIGAKSIRVTKRGTPILAALSSIPTLTTVGIASPTPSVEELTPRHKKPRTRDKQKKKADSRSSSIWDDDGVALAHAQDVFSADDTKVFSKVSANEVMGHHLHKLVEVPVQVYIFCSSFLFLFSFFVKYICIFFSGVRRESLYYFRVPSSRGQGRVCVDPCENLGGKKFEIEERADIYPERGQPDQGKVKTLTDDLRTERQFTAARENIKGIVAKAVEGFLQTKEYNTVLFNWYFKGFELLRRYFIKHPSGVDLEKLDI